MIRDDIHVGAALTADKDPVETLVEITSVNRSLKEQQWRHQTNHFWKIYDVLVTHRGK
jgi:hypothetical protein